MMQIAQLQSSLSLVSPQEAAILIFLEEVEPMTVCFRHAIGNETNQMKEFGVQVLLLVIDARENMEEYGRIWDN